MSKLTHIRDWPAQAAAARYRAKELARLCGISSSHLRRTFLRRFGIPPQRWLTEHRLAQACQLLESGRAAKEIAHALYFADAAQLCHQFKRRFGATPRQWLARRKNAERHRTGPGGQSPASRFLAAEMLLQVP